MKGAHPVYGEDAPDVLRTTARVDEVMARWEGMVPVSMSLIFGQIFLLFL